MRLSGRFLFAFGEFKGNIGKKYSNQNQGCSYLSESINIPKIHFSSLLSNQTVRSKNSIARAMLIVKIKKSCKVLGKEILDPINGAASQTADRLMERPENALSQG